MFAFFPRDQCFGSRAAAAIGELFPCFQLAAHIVINISIGYGYQGVVVLAVLKCCRVTMVGALVKLLGSIY